MLWMRFCTFLYYSVSNDIDTHFDFKTETAGQKKNDGWSVDGFVPETMVEYQLSFTKR